MSKAWNHAMGRYILLFGVLGLVGCFLPIVGGARVSLFDLRGVSLLVLAFLVPALVAWRGNLAHTILASIAGFGYAGYKVGPRALDLILYAGIGGKLIGVAVIGGVIATIGACLEQRTLKASGASRSA